MTAGSPPDGFQDVAGRVAALRRRIEAAGDPDRVTIVAVTKGFGPEAVAAATAAGLMELGESYDTELVTKAAAVADDRVRWHFVGRLQTNKVRRVAPLVHLWQSVDRPALVAELARRAPGARVLVQVNVSQEPQKGGCEPAATAGLVAEATGAGLEVLGLMCVAASGGPEAARPGFRLLRGLADDLGLPERSMGMSGDLEAAVAEGATMVRIGTSLFGERPGPRGRGSALRH